VLAHWRNLLLVLANLPFALVGGVVAVFFHERLLSLGALVGFVTLFGITTRNSIMLIAHYEHLVAREGQSWNLETALRGAGERLGPILMTALVTALGLLPLALGGSEAGREIEGPMALVILGGLVSSTVLNLLVLPRWRSASAGLVARKRSRQPAQISLPPWNRCACSSSKTKEDGLLCPQRRCCRKALPWTWSTMARKPWRWRRRRPSMPWCSTSCCRAATA
jgi:predicted RND superfamily exporter protein